MSGTTTPPRKFPLLPNQKQPPVAAAHSRNVVGPPQKRPPVASQSAPTPQHPMKRPWKIWKPDLASLLAEVPGALYLNAASGGAEGKVAFHVKLHGFNECGQVCELLLRRMHVDVLDPEVVAAEARANAQTLAQLKGTLEDQRREVRAGLIHDQAVPGEWKKELR